MLNVDEKGRNMSTTLLIAHCMLRMGFGNLFEGQYVLPTGIDETKLSNVDWRGVHAPTALGEILERLNCIFALQADGKVKIERVGVGARPNVSADQLLAELPAEGLDRRGKTVVFTSWPNQVVKTAETSDDFELVGLDADGKWKALKDLSYLNGMSPLETARNAFYNVPFEHREQAKALMYRCIRLKPDKFPHLVLKQRYENQQPLPVKVEANLALPVAKLWTNSSVTLRATHLYVTRIDGKWNSILRVHQTLLRVTEPAFTDPDEDFAYSKAAELRAGDLKLTISAEAYEKPAADGIEGRPVYFAVGFTREDGALRKLSAEETKAALESAPDRIVVPEPSWILHEDVNGGSNRAELEAQAERQAARYLRDGAASVTQVILGYYQVELSGVVSEISINQGELKTEVQCLAWYQPNGVTPASFRKLMKGQNADPRARVAVDRVQRGADPQPVTSLGPSGGATAGGEAPMFAIISSAERQGEAWRWIYQGWIAQKFGLGYGGGDGESNEGWQAVDMPGPITIYNMAEAMNHSTGGAPLLGNGYDTRNLEGTQLEPKPIPIGRVVRIYRVQTLSPTLQRVTEYWCDWNNAVDGPYPAGLADVVWDGTAKKLKKQASDGTWTDITDFEAC